ncbi:MAG: stage II sporulation protein E [Actinobacteria bacterium 13_2_20CM_2_71_6]|nr:MAG: stage II sporulation protein E [Actinobacteria bacterium 13_2_20CM_2_71_6]
MISGWLDGSGYAVATAGTGTEALLLLESTPVDLVIVDVALPDMTGFELSEQVKALPVPHAIPVIHMSNATLPVNRTQGLARGADAYLVEPVEPDEMIATVRAVLHYYRALNNAERLARRLARLAQTTRELHTATNLRQMLRAAVLGATAIFESPVAVCVETAEGLRLSVSTEGPGAEITFQPCPVELFDLPVGVLVHYEPATNWSQIAWPDDGRVRVVGARLRPERAPVYVAIPAQVGDPGAPVHTQLTQAISVAIDVMRAYQEEHRLALTLQRSLLPTHLPTIDGYDVAVRYVPASEQAEIGGDFYELSPLDGTLAVAVGDVAGHSLHAATVMAELRHATRAYLAEGHPPSAVLDRLNQLLVRLIPGEMATLCLLLIDRATGAGLLANAGHPPPLVSVDGKVEFLTERSALLGLRAERGPDVEMAIPHGGTLVLYTDGLVERRGEHIDVGISALARAAEHVETDLDEFCDRLLAEVGPEHPDDDIAIVALRRRT